MSKPNLTYIQKLACRDKDFEQKLLSIIKKEFPVEKATYFKLLKNKNYVELAQLVHKIKHKFVIFGLEEEAILAFDFEEDIKNKSLDLHIEFQKALNTITDFLNKL